jgi:hypothetical protein
VQKEDIDITNQNRMVALINVREGFEALQRRLDLLGMADAVDFEMRQLSRLILDARKICDNQIADPLTKHRL